MNFYVVLVCCGFYLYFWICSPCCFADWVSTQGCVSEVFGTCCILFIIALLCLTCLSGANLVIAIPLMANVGLVSVDSYDSFTPASGCWCLVFSFIRDVVVDLELLLSGCTPV